MSQDGTLGNGTHQVFVNRRGQLGGGVLLPVISGFASKQKDDTATGQVIVPGTPACCKQLDTIGPGTHEISIHRNGERDPWFVGPIWDIEEERDDYKITFRDLSSWFDMRVIHNDMSWEDEDLAVVFVDVVNDALFAGPVEDNPGISFDVDPTGVLYTGGVVARTRQYAGQILRGLGKRGVDWFMCGRVLVLRRHQTQEKSARWDASFFVVLPKIRRSLSDYVGFAYALGQTGVEGIGGGYDPDFGLIERTLADPNLTNDFDATAIAEDWAAASGVGSYIDPSKRSALSPNAGIRFDDLIPGCVFWVELPGCPPTAGPLRLCTVRVKWDGGGESVEVGLEPVSSQESAFIAASEIPA